MIKNWIWIRPRPDAGPEVWRRQLAQCRDAGLAAALAYVYPGSEAYFASQHLPVATEMLAPLADIAAEEGIELHAWVATLRCNTRLVQESHPEWFCVSCNGDSSLDTPPYIGSYQFLCPAQDAVRDFVRQTITELAGHAQISGIHLDYVRLPDVILPDALQPKYDLVQDTEFPQFDFCYCQHCRDTFRAQEGVDPLELPHPINSVAWRQFRYDSITRLVEIVSQPARAAGNCL